MVYGTWNMYWYLWIHEIVIACDFVFQTAVIIVWDIYLNLNKTRFNTNMAGTFEFLKLFLHRRFILNNCLWKSVNKDGYITQSTCVN
jgi:hypothetical protein